MFPEAGGAERANDLGVHLGHFRKEGAPKPYTKKSYSPHNKYAEDTAPFFLQVPTLDNRRIWETRTNMKASLDLIPVTGMQYFG